MEEELLGLTVKEVEDRINKVILREFEMEQKSKKEICYEIRNRVYKELKRYEFFDFKNDIQVKVVKTSIPMTQIKFNFYIRVQKADRMVDIILPSICRLEKLETNVYSVYRQPLKENSFILKGNKRVGNRLHPLLIDSNKTILENLVYSKQINENLKRYR